MKSIKRLRNLCVINMFFSAIVFSYLELYGVAIFAILTYLVAAIMLHLKEK